MGLFVKQILDLEAVFLSRFKVFKDEVVGIENLEVLIKKNFKKKSHYILVHKCFCGAP